MTQLIPPGYGIVDCNSFFVSDSVVGRLPQVGIPGSPCLRPVLSELISYHNKALLHMAYLAWRAPDPASFWSLTITRHRTLLVLISGLMHCQSVSG